VDFNNISPDLVFPFRSETGTVLEELLKDQDDWLLKYHLALIYKDRNRIAESKRLFISCGNDPGYAPFYAARAEIFKDSASMAIADLQKALSLENDQWRYYKLLAEYYNNHQQYEKALPTAENFYRSHPQNYIMGMLYAKTLLFNKKYKECDAILSKLHIIPFEGATDGRELYREAKLMQAVEQMQKKNLKEAISFITEAKQWPVNLGVGKPYDEDIDDRLENWIEYLCYAHLNKMTDANNSLQKIVQFNSTQNSYPENAVVEVWAYEKLGEKDKARQWLNKQLKAFPNNKRLLWGKSVLEGNYDITLSETEKNTNVRILEQLMLMK
jgi:tetratricopeptide (TPR) repeat protein